jgi:hypothetical protein
MARLFITDRELSFISDITKEIIKDVIGQKVFYYPVSEEKTKTHGVYNEATSKVFDNPIALDCLVDSNFQTETKIDQFGVDAQYKVEIFVQYRDMFEKGITPSIGDYFSFSTIFYEITDLVITRNIFGLPEHKDGIKMTGTKVRDSQFKAQVLGPTDISETVQHDFEQQRGRTENSEGPTGDVRDLVRNGVLDAPISPPRKVNNPSSGPSGPSFYDED